MAAATGALAPSRDQPGTATRRHRPCPAPCSAVAIPFEGDPSPTRCVRVLALSDAAPAGSSLFLSHGYVAVLVPRWGC